ncbi:RluA family pseudouridine synthase [Zoogloea sp.]|uniref:RluA family pseudouridine synthase n=1 Tax=Zoogloea sp. TaxID=49181 RepID=UPI0035B41453
MHPPPFVQHLADPPTPIAYSPPPGLPPILYADDALLIVEKPPGLLSVPGRGPGHADCLLSRVHALFPDARIVHRLDMATSGLMVLARGAEMERRLSIAFQKRQVGKCYLAVVAGWLTPDQGEIHLPLITDWPNRPRQKVDPAAGKASFTEYTVAAHCPEDGTSRVTLIPHTGRSHQLRVHMQAIGHPILGDELYADPANRYAAPRLLLHAIRLSLEHPVSGQRLSFDSPAPF